MNERAQATIHRIDDFAKRTSPDDPLQHGDGGGTYDGMETRVTRLETHMEYVRRDLDEVKADLKVILAALPTFATKRDLANFTLAGLGLGFAVMAIVIGGIIGGLAWIGS